MNAIRGRNDLGTVPKKLQSIPPEPSARDQVVDLHNNQRPRARLRYAGAFGRDGTLELLVFLMFNLDRFWTVSNRGALDSRQEKT